MGILGVKREVLVIVIVAIAYVTVVKVKRMFLFWSITENYIYELLRN